MKAWMVFVKPGRYHRKEWPCWSPPMETRRQCVAYLKDRNLDVRWEEIMKEFSIRKVTIEIEY